MFLPLRIVGIVRHRRGRLWFCLMCCLMTTAISSMAQEEAKEFSPITSVSDSVSPIVERPEVVPIDSLSSAWNAEQAVDSAVVDSTLLLPEPLPPLRTSSFNPDGMRAVWLSALFPGLGQIYNRRYWKLPIVVGGFVGLVYATSWNNRMLMDYQQAYLDIMDSDPTTNSYMDFFPPTYSEEDLDKTWLTNILKQRKDAYRYYRDYCIVGMVGLYLVCILDAYVDAELYHFDMSTDLSMVVKPALIPVSLTQWPAIGLQCAITF